MPALLLLLDGRRTGLAYVRVPTWLPCRLQIYFNGHNWPAAQLRKQHIQYELGTTPSWTSGIGNKRNAYPTIGG